MLTRRVCETEQAMSAVSVEDRLIGSSDAGRKGLSADLLTRFFQVMDDALVIADRFGVVVEANNTFCRIIGAPPSEIIGFSLQRFYCKDGKMPGEDFGVFWRMLADCGRWRGDIRLSRRDGHAFVVNASTAVLHADAFGFARDGDSDGDESEVYIAALISVRQQASGAWEPCGADFGRDRLTGLLDRTGFFAALEDGLNGARPRFSTLAALFIDIDDFKLFNESLGHDGGDRLLKTVAQRLVGSVGANGTVARMGGDEFAVALTDFESQSDLSRIAENIQAQLLEPAVVDGHTVHVSATVGLSVFPHGGGDAVTLAVNAETTMYRIKRKGPGGYGFFDPSAHKCAAGRLDLQSDLRQAAEANQFALHYQPKINLENSKVRGCEALIRWQHPAAGVVPPSQFISLAEDTGLILPIGLWALRAACEECRAWNARGFGHVGVAVNLSARQFRQADLTDQIAAIIADTEISPDQLEIEITESTAMDDAGGAIIVMKRLRDMGVRICIDDFGTGYSSLSYLNKFPLNTIKIDRSFISGWGDAYENEAIIGTIVSLGKILNLDVVAEGIENEEQVNFLRKMECPTGQGYYFAFPLPSNDFHDWLAATI